MAGVAGTHRVAQYRPGGVRLGHLGGPIGGALGRLPARALLVAGARGGLEQARGDEPERHAAGDHGPRPAPSEVLDVAEDAIGVALCEVAAEPLGAIGGLLGQLGRLVFALLAQLLADAAHVRGVAADALPGLGRAPVDLRAQLGAGLLLRLTRRLLRLLLGLLAGRWLAG